METIHEKWPSLPYNEWKDVLDTLHMCMQIAGKVKLKLSPYINHWWNVAFHLTASGITSGLISFEDKVFEIIFDFINHNVKIKTSDDKLVIIKLYPRSVSEFYREFMDALRSLGIKVTINTIPSEVPDPVSCEVDTVHCHYNEIYVNRWWHILLNLYVIFERLKSPFYGKSSPVHFFWGSFDLSLTLFSGRPAPPPANNIIMRFAENMENFAFGFWSGNPGFPYPALYAYIYPSLAGIETITVKPDVAYFDKNQHLFILLYDDVIKSRDPQKMIMDFFRSTYENSTKLADWDIKLLEGPVPE